MIHPIPPVPLSPLGLYHNPHVGACWGLRPIRINFRAVALKTHFVVRDVASKAGNIAHDKDILWGPEAPKPPPGGLT